MIGRKLGMTRLFADDGSVVPVSVIAAPPNTITRRNGPSTDRVTTSRSPWFKAPWSSILCTSSGQSCIKPSMADFLVTP